MSVHRVTLEYDLHLDDEAAARELATDLIRRQVAETEAGGIGVESGLGSPEVASFELGQELSVAATMIAVQVLKNGMHDMPDWIVVARPAGRNEQIS